MTTSLFATTTILPDAPNEVLNIVQSTKSLPESLLYLGFWVGLILSFIQLFKFFYTYCVSSKLEVRLTKEIFFRVANWGESVFPNIVIISRIKISEIQEVSLTLKKVATQNSSSEETLSVIPKFFGEKCRHEGNPFADNYFDTQSPLSFIPVNSPKRMTILAIVDDSETKYQNIIKDFESSVQNFKEECIEAVTDEEPKSGKSLTQLHHKKQDIINEYSTKFFDCIKLQSGKYQLTVLISYKTVDNSVLAKKVRSSTSQIEFEVEEGFRERCLNGIKFALDQIIEEKVTNKTTYYRHPEYRPINVKEIY